MERRSPRNDDGDMGSKAAAFRALAGNRALLRVVAGYALFILTEYSVWIAMLVYAYARGGAMTAGLVALVQLVPAALLAPVFPALASRRSPVVLLVVGYLAQAAAMGATAAGVVMGVPLAAYGAAVVASTAVTATRPAQSMLIPSLAVTPDQLTATELRADLLTTASLPSGISQAPLPADLPTTSSKPGCLSVLNGLTVGTPPSATIRQAGVAFTAGEAGPQFEEVLRSYPPQEAAPALRMPHPMFVRLTGWMTLLAQHGFRCTRGG
jgi:hypothetical protein